jgi:hypothetical protein
MNLFLILFLILIYLLLNRSFFNRTLFVPDPAEELLKECPFLGGSLEKVVG